MSAADAAWCRTHYATMNEGGVWAVPRSGLVFCKRNGGLVLVTRMPWSEELAQAAADGLDVPASEQALHAYQDADYELIRSRFAAADIPVTRADG